MKDKIRKQAKVILILATVLLVVFGVFYLFDIVWNGVLLDWFAENFMIARQVNDPETGQLIFMWEPYWDRVKSFLLVLFITVILIWTVIIMVASKIYGKRKMQEMELEIQRKEEILKEETQRKNDLIAYLAHDLKTPLTSVVGYLNLLDEAPDMPAEQKAKYVRISLNKALRLEKLINEFFEITRYNLQQIVLDKNRTDIYYMLVQMKEEFYPILKEHGNTIELNVEQDLTLLVDAGKMARVFNNILKNAVAYSYPYTPIMITAEKQKDKVCITFQNMGATIPREKLDAIFEKFFRMDEARATNTGGAGLGLAIAKEIVTLHGGTITAESENEMITFAVELPL